MSDQQAYRFRWINIDMEDFVRQCRGRSDKLRRDAELLLKRAEQIDEEARTWEAALEEVDQPDPAP